MDLDEHKSQVANDIFESKKTMNHSLFSSVLPRDAVVGVVGLGRSGVASARWLVKHGWRIKLIDHCETLDVMAQFDGDVPEGELRLGTFSANSFDGCDVLLTSPGISIRQPWIAEFAKTREVIGDIELFARALNALPSKLIAISGSNGKSTVTELCGHLARHAGLNVCVAGNIGLPVLEALLEYEESGVFPDLFVLELSSFQLETTRSLNATAATVLNISEDHLNRYNDLLDYAHSKSSIFNGDGVQVLNRDDPFVCAMTRADRKVITFSLSRSADYRLLNWDHVFWLAAEGKTVFDLRTFHPIGFHNAANALAALALCEACGLPRASLLEGLTSFRGLPHRMEWVAKVGEVDFFDDSKGTNVGATVAALRGLDRPAVIILGGEGKGQDFAPLGQIVAEKCRAALLIGEAAPLIKSVLTEYEVPFERCDSLETATRRAFELAHSGDVVLLSPACASFDMFCGYAHRAEVFISEVNRLRMEQEHS